MSSLLETTTKELDLFANDVLPRLRTLSTCLGPPTAPTQKAPPHTSPHQLHMKWS